MLRDPSKFFIDSDPFLLSILPFLFTSKYPGSTVSFSPYTVGSPRRPRTCSPQGPEWIVYVRGRGWFQVSRGLYGSGTEVRDTTTVPGRQATPTTRPEGPRIRSLDRRDPETCDDSDGRGRSERGLTVREEIEVRFGHRTKI